MDKILVLDFGGQYAHLISRRVRDLGYEAEIVPPSFSIEKLKHQSASGIILSGGARSVYEKNAPKLDRRILNLGIPVLGICYGHQLIAAALGGKVKKGDKGEYGKASLRINQNFPFLDGIGPSLKVWMNHRDAVSKLPSGFSVLARTAATPIAAFGNTKRKIFGVQFHPEVTHTEKGDRIIKNFLKLTSGKGIKKISNIADFTDEAANVLGPAKAIVGLSGGVDSSVAAILVSKVIGSNLLAVYVDTGLMREGETAEIRTTFKKFPLKLKIVNAAPQFFKALAGVSDPERKRKIIGNLFIKIFEKEARKFKAKFLIQGTIYSDRIESGLTKHSSKIKSHHNVGGLPKSMNLKIYEPLRELYKDEVRVLGRRLGLPEHMVERKAFPGPGLAIRILGEVTPEKVRMVRRASRIIEEELRRAGFMKRVWMAFPVLLSIKSVGIQGDARTYKYPLVLRIIESKDVMTANFSRPSWPVLEKISGRITNEIEEINRVVYDISNKPPATMEWE